jgi:hypothetical protein
VRDRVSGPRKKRSENLSAGVARLRDSDISTVGAVWAIAEREWNTGGTKDSRVTKCRGNEIHVGIESRSIEELRTRVDAWQSERWDRASRGLMN